jgi:hypothetical protein
MNAGLRRIKTGALLGALLTVLLVPSPGRAGWEVAEINRQWGAVVAGRSDTFRVRFAPRPEVGPVIIDLELRDITGRRVAQEYAETTGKDLGWFSITSPALPPGTYYLSIGVFSPGWKTMLAWSERVSAFTVYERSPCGGDCRVELRQANWSDGVLGVVLESKNTANTVLVDLELYDAKTNRKVAQKFWDAERFDARATRTYAMRVPPDLPPGEYYWSVGVFYPHWTDLASWSHAVKRFAVK